MKRPAIHGIDKDISEKLTIEHFYTEIDSKKFIDGLSSSIVSEARNDESSKEFVAKPFIRSFEYALASLQELRISVRNRIQESEATFAEANKQQNNQITTLMSSFKEVQVAAQELEGRIGEVGNTAVQIGQQLETLDKQLQRARQARDLVRFFLEFAQQGQCLPLEDMRSVQGPDGQYKAAIIARKLSNLAKELDLPGIEKTCVSIEKYNENLEKDLLETFDQAYTQGDITTMASCSKTLLDFNGGNSCVQTYINQHEFFMSQRKMRESSIALAKDSFEASQSGINDPNEPPPPPDPWMVKLYGEVRAVVAKEWDVISKVFPNSLFVIRQFLERIFGQSIEYYLEGLLDKAERQSPLAYLRTLASTHSCTSNLVSDLQQFDRQYIYPIMHRKALASAAAAKGQTGTNIADVNTASVALGSIIDSSIQERGFTAVSSTVERCLEDFFTHIRYLDKEVTFLSSALLNLIEPYMSSRSKSLDSKFTKKSMFTRLAKATDMLTTGVSTPPDSTSPSLSNAGTPAINVDDASRDVMNLIQSSTLSEVVIKILCVHGEAIGRCAELSPPGELSSHTTRLFSLLIDVLGDRFLERLLQKSLAEIKQRDTRSVNLDEITRTFQSASDVHKVMKLIQQHFQFAILPLVSSSPPAYRELVLKKNGFFSSLENTINLMLQAETTGLLRWVGQILSTQPRNTFKIKDDDVDFAVLSMATETCSQCVETLRKVFIAAQLHLKGENLTSLAMEIGINLHGLLLDHYKKFTVSLSGGLLLFQDISQYQAMIRDLKVEELTSRFEVLKEIADLLCMPNPASIPSLLRGGTLASLDPVAILPYLKCREDFLSADLPRLLSIRPDTLTSSSQVTQLDEAHALYPTATAANFLNTGPSTPMMGGASGYISSAPTSSESVNSAMSSAFSSQRRN